MNSGEIGSQEEGRRKRSLRYISEKRSVCMYMGVPVQWYLHSLYLFRKQAVLAWLVMVVAGSGGYLAALASLPPPPAMPT